MKKLIGLLISAMLILSFLVANFPLNASGNVVMLSIYDDIFDVYLLENRKIEIEAKTTLTNLLDDIVNKKIISEYIVEENEIISISIDEETSRRKILAPYKAKIILRVNGKNYDLVENINKALSSGDIIEIIYKIDEEEAETSSTTSSEVSTPVVAPVWDSSFDTNISNAATWLNTKKDESGWYIISTALAGKNPNIKTVNQLEEKIMGSPEYSASSELVLDILSATLCGFDASSDKYGKLVTRLATYPDIMNSGIYGAINPLLAYDVNDYEISSSILNSREKLINNILIYQNEDGGFPITEESKSDIDTTAFAITVLAKYNKRADVYEAIKKAIVFLDNSQTQTGGFGFNGKDNCESLASVIVALCSNGIQIKDKRFMFEDKSLLDLLLEYQNVDGGFSHTIGEQNDIIATEQAIIALCAIKKNGNPYILQNKVEHNTESVPSENTQLVQEPEIDIVMIILAVVAFIGIVVLIVVNVKRNKN